MEKKLYAITILIISIITITGCTTTKTENVKIVANQGERKMYKIITPNMMVADMNKTLNFYKDILGFDLIIGVLENSENIVTEKQEDQGLQFAIVKSGDVELMFQTTESLTKEMPYFDRIGIKSSSILYIEVEDVKKLYEKLKDKVTIIKDMEAKFYGKQEFYIQDCNGYILGFAGNI